MAPVFLIGTLLAASAVFVLSVVGRPASADKLIVGWSHFFIALAGSRLETVGRDNIDRSNQYVFIANHLSNLDIPVMFIATGMPIRYLAKAELFKIPVLKQAMTAIGIVRVDRVAGSAIHSEVNVGVAAAKEHGQSLIVFPEGTRSLSGEMATFKKGAFRIALANQLDIIPVTLAGTWESWRPGSKIVTGGPLRAVIHPPIPVQGLTLDKIDTLRDQTHSVIHTEYQNLRSNLLTTTRTP